MLKQKYFLTGIFILSAERQPIKLAWRKIVWLLVRYHHNCWADLECDIIIVLPHRIDAALLDDGSDEMNKMK
ncbi:hypothetical protein DUT93_21875 [Bacteroides xylanisolvens]|nr:hypothetical protein [Bacteroides xylanisolvens]